MRTLRGGSAAAVAALALGLIVARPAHAEGGATATVEELPFAVDSSNQAAWWNPLDVVGDVTFLAFNAPAPQAARHEVHLASRAADGTWTEGCLRTTAGAACVTFVDDNGHNQPSIVVDGDGVIHAFVSMHNEQWNYFRSDTAGDVRTMVDRTATMPDLDVDITYPVTARGADGDAWVLVRTGTDADGAREGVLYHFDRDAGSWARETTIAAATGYSFYPDDLEVSPDGRVHVLWEWGPFPADPARHLGSYAVYDPATGTLADVAGTTVSGPITPASAGAVVWRPFSPGEAIGSYTPAVQSAKLALDGSSLAGIGYRFVEKDRSAYDARFARWDGSAWADEKVVDTAALGDGVATSAAVDVTRAGSTTRLYTVVTAQVCGEVRSRAVVAERDDATSTWSYAGVGEARLGQQRLRAHERSTDDADVVYLSAPVAAPARLSHAVVPRDGPVGPVTSLSELVADLRDDPGGVNVALGATATASSSLRADTGPERAVDGVCSDASRWISAVGDTAPWISLDLTAPAALAEVRVRSGYSAEAGSAAVLRSFEVQVRTSTGWTTIGSATANTQRLVSIPVAGVVADGVRLLISDPSASATDVARVFEIEAIAVE
jgi:hypothetical protein